MEANNWRRATIALAVYSLIATVTLAWFVGRQGAPVAPVSQVKPAVAAVPAPQPPKPPAKPVVQYPTYQSEIPVAFRGNWDEITSDKCEGREARFYLGAREFANFEVDWEVTQVKLYSPTEIDVHTSGYDENKNQIDAVWQFKLVDGGKSLTSRKPGGLFFKKCPVLH